MNQTTDREIWTSVLAHIREHEPDKCRQWFEQLDPVDIRDGVFRIKTLTTVHKDYLNSQCQSIFDDALRAVTGRLVSARFLQQDEPDTLPTNKQAHAFIEPRPSINNRTDQLNLSSLILNPDSSFENFVMGPGNRLAHAAALAIAQNPGNAYNPFFVYGDVGLGKTHLLQAICLKIIEYNTDARIRFLSCESFMTQFMESVQIGKMAEFRDHHRDVDVLVIDDIQFIANRARTQEEFFHTFNSLHQLDKQIIISCDRQPEEIPDLEERLISRFKWGLVAELDAPCYETRVAIVQKKAQLRALDLHEDVACFIAQRIDSNIRELEGAITRIQIQAMVDSAPITLDLARLALGEPAPADQAVLSIQAIIDATTAYFGVRMADLQSKRRPRSIALPRQVCMYLARKHTRHSLEEIGGYFGGRDHTTVMHAIKTIDNHLIENPDVQSAITVLERQLGRSATN